MEFFDEIIAVLKKEQLTKQRLSVDTALLNKLAEKTPNPQKITPSPSVNSAPTAGIDANFSSALAQHIQSKPVEVNSNTISDMKCEIMSCDACELSKYRKNALCGIGNKQARLMFIGEAPSANDDENNQLFSGDVGELLDKMIMAMGFSGREEVYLTTLLKCRPPGNRVAEKFEVEKCIGYLKKDIELVNPEAIVVFGANTVKYLVGKEGTISELRGKILYYRNIPLMPTFNPAYLLRKAAAKREVWQDLQEVMKILGMKK